MKYKYIPIIFFALFIGVVASCSDSGKPSDVSHYTCPMHPTIKMDAPGSCPICGMNLVPVKKEIDDEHKGHDMTEKKPKGIKIDPTHVQNIGVKTEEVRVRSLTRTIVAYGKVAHDPKLWVAQREYIEALKLRDRSLIESARLKLLFLGLSQEWIDLIKKKRTANLGLHLPTEDEPTYFEAFIYQGDVLVVHKGLTVEIIDDNARVLQSGVVEAIGTMVSPDTRLVRILVKAEGVLDFKSNTFVQFRIKIPLGDKLSVLEEAILFNGDHNMVYVVTKKGRYVAKRVELGIQAGDYFEVKAGLKAGEEVVTNGHFLIDSETKIKMGGTGVEHQH